LALRWINRPFPDLQLEELYALLRLRQEVFVVEQDCPYLDLDGRDQPSTHMLCYDGDVLVACQRCLPPGVSYPESSMGRIVVAPSMRGAQLGRELVRRGIEHNFAAWPGHDICISAQSHLQAFYGSLGFSGEGQEYMEDGIAHRKMRFRAA